MEAEPFLRWAGGKRRLVTEILKLLPATFGTYHEPFLGGGAVFFALRPQRAELSDTNERLVKTYAELRRDPKRVMKLIDQILEAHAADPSSTYAKARRLFDQDLPEYHTAALLIYLNKTGFNGLFRVNAKGGYNVPIGSPNGTSRQPSVYNAGSLQACVEALQCVAICHRDFVKASATVVAGDAVYMDPPYAPLSATANFTAYTASGFSAADQVVVRDTALKLARRGAHVVVSNSSAPLIREIYAGSEFEVREVSVGRTGGTAKGRGSVKELLISAVPQ